MTRPTFWKRAAIVAAGLGLLEIGRHVRTPGVNSAALIKHFDAGGGTWMMELYESVSRGGMHFAGILTIGAMPYFAARIFMRLARIVSPTLEEIHQFRGGRRALSRWTQVLTVGISIIQSYGFARFIQSVPGAVLDPGPGPLWVAQTTAMLTAGAVAVMLLAEQVRQLGEDDRPEVPEPPSAITAGDGADLLQRAATISKERSRAR